MDEITKIIDVEKAIRSSKSNLVRSLPGFIIKLLARLVHQDELNSTIHKYRYKTGVPFVNDILKEWNVKVVTKGETNIPPEGRFVFVANHPVGGTDALAFLSTIYRFYTDVVSPSNELFKYIPNLRPVILGVNVFGVNTKDTVKSFNNLFESDSQIMIFPAGIVSRRKRGVISDLVWQKTFVTKAVQFKRDIIPVHISGRNSNLFYLIANLRKFLGIKLSLEIILLPREMFNLRNTTITMTIGKVIPWETITSEKPHNNWAQYIREEVYKLKES